MPAINFKYAWVLPVHSESDTIEQTRCLSCTSSPVTARVDVCYNCCMSNSTKAAIVRGVLALCIVFSISLMYYVYIVKKEYVVLTNPDGPDLTDTY